MTKRIEINNTTQAHEGTHKPGRRRHLISKSKNAPKLKRLNDGLIQGLDESNFLESLPQEIVVNILTKLRHSDLKHSLLVSKFISEAALVARKTHFLFSTPSTKPVFSRSLELSDSEVPKAPKASRQMRTKQQKARKFRCDGRRLSSVFLLLLNSPEIDDYCA